LPVGGWTISLLVGQCSRECSFPAIFFSIFEFDFDFAGGERLTTLSERFPTACCWNINHPLIGCYNCGWVRYGFSWMFGLRRFVMKSEVWLADPSIAKVCLICRWWVRVRFLERNFLFCGKNEPTICWAAHKPNQKWS